MAGVAFAVDGDGVGFATESYAASALYTTLANLSGAFWRIRRVRLPLDAARCKAREIIDQSPHTAFTTVVQNWRQLPDGRIEFPIRHFPAAVETMNRAE